MTCGLISGCQGEGLTKATRGVAGTLELEKNGARIFVRLDMIWRQTDYLLVTSRRLFEPLERADAAPKL